ncbi:hypothetical protein [Tychonema sp. LEGE 07196]|uniref:hypothetical protein n=1 Tax=Tychonema sp. LEGE 07196 TaxID=1828665 RepID=UPI0030DA0425
MAGVGFFAGFGGGDADFVAVWTGEVSAFLGMLSKFISLILLQKSCSDFLKLSISICRAACLISGVAKGVEAKLLRNKDKLENIKVRITEVTISKISLSFIGRRKFGNEQCTGCNGCNGCNGCKSVGIRKKSLVISH